VTLFDNPAEVRELHSGVQRKYKFANGYGASVVRHAYSYGGPSGMWELAVLGLDGDLTYDTPVTDDVVGWLTEADVDRLLGQVQALMPQSEATAKIIGNLATVADEVGL
jgi:hypothetical protein